MISSVGYYSYEEINTIGIRVKNKIVPKLHELLSDFIYISSIDMFIYHSSYTKKLRTYETTDKLKTFENKYYITIGEATPEILENFNDPIIRLNIVKRINPDFEFEILKYNACGIRYASHQEINLYNHKKSRNDETIYISHLISELSRGR